jgi:hypothetical protein
VAVEEVSIFFVVSNSAGVDLGEDDGGLGFVLVFLEADMCAFDSKGINPVGDVLSSLNDKVVTAVLVIRGTFWFVSDPIIIILIEAVSDVGNFNVLTETLVDCALNEPVDLCLQLSLIGNFA